MTTLEFINEFDIGYNNIRSNGAPGLDLYEQSVLLTKAQEQLVLNYFDPNSNPRNDGFENSEKRRRGLEKLIKNYYTNNDDSLIEEVPDLSGIALENFKNYFVSLPADVFFIIQESGNILRDEDDVAFNIIRTIPMTHDEIMLQEENPFRQPNISSVSRRLWRVDNSLGTFDDSVEVVIPLGYSLANYQMRYIEKPIPIVLTDLLAQGGEFDGMGLSIDGVTDETQCQLSSLVHRQIVDRAVELAKEAFEKASLQTAVAMSSRNE